MLHSKKGVILLVSETVIFILVMNALLTIASWQEKLEEEAEALDLLRELEFASYNALFDLCWRLKSNITGTNIEEANDNALNLTTQWCELISRCGGTVATGIRAVASVDPISVEAYTGQPVDAYQTKYIGRDGGEKWFVSGNLVLEFWKEDLLMRATYEIRIAV